MLPASAPLSAPPDELAAIADGRAAADLSGYRKVLVRGRDAARWLHDLVTTDVMSLDVGQGRRSLLLDPTGHIRADLQVARGADGYWLFQAPDQGDDVARALAPYVLSSDVGLDDVGADRGLITLFSDDPARTFRPSALPEAAVDVLVEPGGRAAAIGERILVTDDAVEVWRIRQGRARMGADFDRSSIPAEAGLSSAIDTTKGCFLGQESVARVRELGHPPRALRHLVVEGVVGVGVEIVDGAGEIAGVVTSAAEGGSDSTVLLASVRWSSVDALLRTVDGRPLEPIASSD